MESKNFTINEHIKKTIAKDYEEALHNDYFKALVKKINIDNEIGQKYTSRLKETIEELEQVKGISEKNAKES